MTKKKPSVIFAPGCFDTFDGTQDELTQLMQEIELAALDGSLFKDSAAVDIESLSEQDPEFAEQLLKQLSNIDTRRLN